MKRRKVTVKDKHTANEKAISNTQRQEGGRSVNELYNPRFNA